jgi:NAD(P)-dependent dehydrogenase (short-subunit alcohol dehydrogenase family)
MLVDFDLREDMRHLPSLIDNEGCPFNAHILFPVHGLLFPHAIVLDDFLVGVRQKLKVQVELVLELLVRVDRIGTDSQYHSTLFLDRVDAVTEVAGLLGTPWRIVLWIEVQNDFLAFQIRQLHFLSRIIEGAEVRRLVSYLHKCVSFRESLRLHGAVIIASPMNISGKVALITGSSKRIGRATAVELARRGASIAVHYRSDEAGARETLRLAREAGSSGDIFHCELTNNADVEKMFANLETRLGGLDILVNSASIFSPGTVQDCTPESWDAQMASNAKAPFFIGQAAAKLMSRRGQGKIVNLVDGSGEMIWPAYFAYSVSKAAFIAVNRGMAKAFAPAIQVNGIAPGPVLFPEYYTQDQKRMAIDRTLLKRAGTAEDIVNAVIFLIENDYITGEVLHVDGGRHIM